MLREVAPPEAVRCSIEAARLGGGRVFICRTGGYCDKDPCNGRRCFVVEPHDPRPWYVIYQSYLRGDA